MNNEFQQENLKLHSIIVDLKSTNEVLYSRVEILEKMILNFKRELFGKKSEILSDSSAQQSLFPNEPLVFNEAEALAAEDITIPGHKRKKAKKFDIHNLSIDQEIIFDLPDAEKICPTHGVPLQKIKEEIVIKVENIPAQKKVIKQIFPIYGPCSDFCGEKQKSQDSFDILPKTMVTPSLMSDLVIAKFQDGLPLYRLELIWERFGLTVTRATMARWLIAVADKCQALMNLLEEDLMSQGYFQCDETHVNVLTVDGKRKTGKSYIWVRYAPVVPIVLYEFHPTRSG